MTDSELSDLVESVERMSKELSSVLFKLRLLEADGKPTPEPTYGEDLPPQFVAFWAAYPQRNGKKVGKAKTLSLWRKLPAMDQTLIPKAAANYAKSQAAKDGFVKDPERFIKDAFWEDWLDGPGKIDDDPENFKHTVSADDRRERVRYELRKEQPDLTDEASIGVEIDKRLRALGVT